MVKRKTLQSKGTCTFVISQEIHKLADKLDKQTRKMIRNYLPFVKIDTSGGKKKGPPKKEAKVVKAPPKAQEPKTYLEKQQEAKGQ